jgi:hypothetical protein
MEIEEIKNKITELAKDHDVTDLPFTVEIQFSEMIEIEAEDLIIAYCERQDYLINGFPTEKRKIIEEKFEDDYFCRERFQLYLETLAIEKDDVAEIWWHYNKSFWPDWAVEKDSFLNELKETLEKKFMILNYKPVHNSAFVIYGELCFELHSAFRFPAHRKSLNRCMLSK